MLYVSTRKQEATFTEYQVLHDERAPDGGLFLPRRIPNFTEEELDALFTKSFSEIVAKILNQFFPAGLKGWDLEFAMGRRPYKVVNMNHRIYIAELWRNYTADFVQTEWSIYNKLCGDDTLHNMPTEWAGIAIRIAVLFGVFAELRKVNVRNVDIALASNDFSAAMVVWYARVMGLPVGTIICACNENENMWDLLHSGVFMPAGSGSDMSTCPKDVPFPQSLERLIFEALGFDETQIFLRACEKGTQYCLDEEQLTKLNSGLVSAVVSNSRRQALIGSILRTHNYVADPHIAIAFGGLQDYRARTGEGRDTLILSYQSPAFFAETIAAATGLTQEEIIKRTKNA